MKRLSFAEMMWSLKATAEREVKLALRHNKITKPLFCTKCGGYLRLEGHHQDYSKPLELEWLCTPCHAKADIARREREAEVFKDMIEKDTQDALRQYREKW